MGYYNIIYQSGENNFLRNCKSSGVDGLIIVDLPWPENKHFAKKCKNKSINFIQLLSPTTSKDRMKKIVDDHNILINDKSKTITIEHSESLEKLKPSGKSN